MTSQTMQERRTMRTRSVRSVSTAVIGWLLVVTGSGHASLVAVGHASGPPAEEQAVRALMSATTVAVAGVERTYWELFQGFSLMMALLLVGLGALLLQLRRRVPEPVRGSRSVLVLLALVLVPALGLSVLLLPPPPIVLLGLAVLAVVAALVRDPAAGELERPVSQG